MPGNRSREWASNCAKGSCSYLVLASVRLGPRVEVEKRQRGKCDVKSQKNMQMNSTEIVEETLHSRLIIDESFKCFATGPVRSEFPCQFPPLMQFKLHFLVRRLRINRPDAAPCQLASQFMQTQRN